MERKKQPMPAKPQSTSALTKTAKVETASLQPESASAVNQRLADLLFDLQSDNEKDSVLKTNPEGAKAQAKGLLAEKQAESPTLIGIMGKCMIPGCDVHTLTLTGEIIEHFTRGQQIDAAFSRARELLSNASSATVGVLVYDSKLELIQLDGTIKPL